MTLAVEQVELRPIAKPVSMDVVLPGSKGFSIRFLLLAALAHGPSRLTGLLMGTDTKSALRVLQTLGIRTEIESVRGQGVVVVHGQGGRWSEPSASLQVGESATLARMLTAILAASPQEYEWVLECEGGLSHRRNTSLFAALRSAGGIVESLQAPQCFPVRVGGGGSMQSTLTVDSTCTSQFVSAALLGAVASGRPTVVRAVNQDVHPGFINMTIAALAQFGHAVEFPDEGEFLVRPNPDAGGRAIAVEPDVSAGAYAASLAALSAGTVRILNYPTSTSQPDAGFLAVLSQMGCEVSWRSGALVIIGPQRLRGGFRMWMNEMADQALTLAVLAMFADRPIEIGGIARVRGHESDRLVAMATAFTNMGIPHSQVGDGIRIVPGLPAPATVEPNRDHRVAMAFALAGAKAEGIRILNPDCVTKSFPGFFEMLRVAGVGVYRGPASGAESVISKVDSVVPAL